MLSRRRADRSGDGDRSTRVKAYWNWSINWRNVQLGSSQLDTLNTKTINSCVWIRFFPIFPGQSRLYEFWRALSRRPAKFGLGHQLYYSFPCHKNTTNLTMYVNILSFPQLQKTSTGAAQPPAGQSQEGTEEGEVWRWMISDLCVFFFNWDPYSWGHWNRC